MTHVILTNCNFNCKLKAHYRMDFIAQVFMSLNVLKLFNITELTKIRK